MDMHGIHADKHGLIHVLTQRILSYLQIMMGILRIILR